MCAGSSTNTKTNRNGQKRKTKKFHHVRTWCHMSHITYHRSRARCNASHVRCQVSGVRCHMSGVMCCMSGVMCCVSTVTCHLSLTPTATATDPPPANSHIMACTLRKKYKKQKKQENKSPVHLEAGFPQWHTHTDTRTTLDIATQ